jgi:hypothetical protein
LLDTLSDTDRSSSSDEIRSTAKKRSRATGTDSSSTGTYNKDSDVGKSSKKRKRRRRRRTYTKNEKRREGHLPSAIFDAVFRVLPKYKGAIDGTNNEQKKEAWRKVVVRLRRDQRLRRELGPEEADAMMGNLEPAYLMTRFIKTKMNTRDAMRRRRSEGYIVHFIVQNNYFDSDTKVNYFISGN